MILTLIPETMGPFLTVLSLTHLYPTHQLLFPNYILDIFYHFLSFPFQPPWSKPPSSLFGSYKPNNASLDFIVSKHFSSSHSTQRSQSSHNDLSPHPPTLILASHQLSLLPTHHASRSCASPPLPPQAWHYPLLGVLTPQIFACWPPSCFPQMSPN